MLKLLSEHPSKRCPNCRQTNHLNYDKHVNTTIQTVSKLLPKIIKFVCAYPNFSKTTIQTTSKLLPKQSSKRCPNYCQNNHLNAHQIVAKTTIQGVSKLLSKQPSKRCPNLCQNNYSNVVQIVVKKHFILISETNNSL